MIVPAVYYAHLASKRGESHIDMAHPDRTKLLAERAQHPGREVSSHSAEMKSETEWPKLLPFALVNNIHLGMWFI